MKPAVGARVERSTPEADKVVTVWVHRGPSETLPSGSPRRRPLRKDLSFFQVCKLCWLLKLFNQFRLNVVLKGIILRAHALIKNHLACPQGYPPVFGENGHG